MMFLTSSADVVERDPSSNVASLLSPTKPLHSSSLIVPVLSYESTKLVGQ